MLIHKVLTAALLLSAGFLGEAEQGGLAFAGNKEAWDGSIVQYGKMHEAIGQKQDQGRVELKKLVRRPHFYGVGALEGLDGETTILDGKVFVTRVDARGQLNAMQAASAADQSATLLVGAYVPSWTEHKVTKTVSPEELDNYVAKEAKDAGISTSAPFVFTVEGQFTDVRFHVIHGACPLHARLKKIQLPKEKQPFETDLAKIGGTIVGVYAKNSAGDITHPGTSTHMHIVFKDQKSGEMVTGHLEQLKLEEGTVLHLPKAK